MRYHNVFIESLGYTLPSEIWTSEDIEQRLTPLYERIKLPAGRLELMTGIQERRFWSPDTQPSDVSIISCNRAIEAANVSRDSVGALIHGSVCRDHLEPATSCRVHHEVGLPDTAVIYDCSNACLGILSGMLQAANMIELGQIQAALIVGTESGRGLVANTIETLNADTTLNRKSIKLAVASLTIGSASCAVLLTHRDISQTRNQLIGASAMANTRFHELCHSGEDAAGGSMKPLMTTDSERLLEEGVKTGAKNFERFLRIIEWQRSDISRSFCHQVGGTHRKLMLEAMDLPPENDFATVSWLGNTGSAALPTAWAIGLEQQPVTTPENIALLGIGSGINCVMAAIDWRQSQIIGGEIGSTE